ncbi:unnamed protein product, partial [marine sediment metagenome]
MRPSEIPVVGPSPMKSSVAAMSIAPPNWRINTMTRYDIIFGAISVKIIFRGFIPLILAKSTKSLERNEKISKIYKTGTFGGKKLLAVNNVSFDIKDGEVISLIGESGSGKSTIGK